MACLTGNVTKRELFSSSFQFSLEDKLRWLIPNPKSTAEKNKNATPLSIIGEGWLELCIINPSDSDHFHGQQAPAQGGSRQERAFTFLVKEQ